MSDDKCECQICKLSRQFQSLEKKATETELEVQQVKRAGTWQDHERGRKKLYVAGPYRGALPGDDCAIARHVTDAIQATRHLHNAGYAVYCPHVQSYHCAEFNEQENRSLGHDDPCWLELVAAWIPCCDGVATVGDFEDSDGSRAEIEQAQELGLPVRSWQDWVDLAEGEMT